MQCGSVEDGPMTNKQLALIADLAIKEINKLWMWDRSRNEDLEQLLREIEQAIATPKR